MIEGGSVILLLLVEDGGAVNDAEEVLWALEELGRGDEEMDVMEEMEVGKIEVDMVVLLVLFVLFVLFVLVVLVVLDVLEVECFTDRLRFLALAGSRASFDLNGKL